MNTQVRMAGVRALAYRSFVPTTREQAIAQYVVAAFERRDFANQNGSHRNAVSRQMALLAIAKANRIKRAVDWRAEANRPLR